MLRDWRFLIFSFVLLSAIYSLFLFNNIHVAHDSMVHYMWLHHVSEQISADFTYPRILTDSNYGFGSPVYYYYPPLSHTLALTLSFIMSISGSLYMTVYLMSFLAVIGVYKLLAQNDIDDTSAKIGALLYVLTPYYIEIDLIYRFAFAELISLCIVPFLFLRYANLSFLTVSVTAIFLCHPPTALIVVPTSFIWQFYNNKNKFFYLLFVYASASVLSAFYLVPALLHPNNSMQVMWEIYSYSKSYINKPIDLASPTKFHTVLRVYSWVSTFFFITFFLFVDKNKTVITVFILGCFSFFMMISYSTFIYELIPLYQKIQFRFRWHSLFNLMFVYLCAALISKYRIFKFIAIPLLIIICFIPSLFYKFDVLRFNTNSQLLEMEVLNKEVPEYSFEIGEQEISLFSGNFFILEGKGSVDSYDNYQDEIRFVGEFFKGDKLKVRRVNFQIIQNSDYFLVHQPKEKYISLEIIKDTRELTIVFKKPQLLFISQYISFLAFFIFTLYIINRLLRKYG